MLRRLRFLIFFHVHYHPRVGQGMFLFKTDGSVEPVGLQMAIPPAILDELKSAWLKA